MISVSEAIDRLLGLVPPLGEEQVSLDRAGDRVLAQDVIAPHNQPPFAASSMDGYAIKNAEVAAGAKFKVIGESAAGHRFDGDVYQGEAVRIFTGAPLPTGTDRVVIQEDVDRISSFIYLHDTFDQKPYVRPAGCDFEKGHRLTAPRRLSAAEIALCAAMNQPILTCARRPEVALISTGDELVLPGEERGDTQIIASNTFGLATMLRKFGANPHILPIARDNEGALHGVLDMCADMDLVITIGGASVGDHDLVGRVLGERGIDLSFYKVAMRPGKPLMAGQIDGTPFVGLPGNPVSAMVCGHVFIAPMVDRMLGLPQNERRFVQARLLNDLPQNGPREHYMRADVGPEGITVESKQDSAFLSVLATSNALVRRPPEDPARVCGDIVDYIAI